MKDSDIKSVLITEEQLAAKVAEMARPGPSGPRALAAQYYSAFYSTTIQTVF